MVQRCILEGDVTEYSRNLKNGMFYVIYKAMQKVRVFLAQTDIRNYPRPHIP